MSIPTLETPRLILRAHRLSDFESVAAMWADPLVARFLGGVLPEEEAWSKFLQLAGMWALLGFGYWTVVEKESGRHAGILGFLDRHRDIQPSMKGMPEIGWAFARTAQGRGYATESALAALEWGRAHFGAVKTVCIIAPENRASIRMAEKIGFKEYARTAYKNAPTIMYTRQL